MHLIFRCESCLYGKLQLGDYKNLRESPDFNKHHEKLEIFEMNFVKKKKCGDFGKAFHL